MRYFAGIEWRINEPWAFRAERIGKVRIKVENAGPVLQDKSAVAEPPDGRRITTGVFDVLNESTSAQRQRVPARAILAEVGSCGVDQTGKKWSERKTARRQHSRVSLGRLRTTGYRHRLHGSEGQLAILEAQLAVEHHFDGRTLG